MDLAQSILTTERLVLLMNLPVCPLNWTAMCQSTSTGLILNTLKIKVSRVINNKNNNDLIAVT